MGLTIMGKGSKPMLSKENIHKYIKGKNAKEGTVKIRIKSVPGYHSLPSKYRECSSTNITWESFLAKNGFRLQAPENNKVIASTKHIANLSDPIWKLSRRYTSKRNLRFTVRILPKIRQHKNTIRSANNGIASGSLTIESSSIQDQNNADADVFGRLPDFDPFEDLISPASQETTHTELLDDNTSQITEYEYNDEDERIKTEAIEFLRRLPRREFSLIKKEIQDLKRSGHQSIYKWRRPCSKAAALLEAMFQVL